MALQMKGDHHHMIGSVPWFQSNENNAKGRFFAHFSGYNNLFLLGLFQQFSILLRRIFNVFTFGFIEQQGVHSKRQDEIFDFNRQ